MMLSGGEAEKTARGGSSIRIKKPQLSGLLRLRV